MNGMMLASSGAAGSMMTIIWMVALFGLMYFFMIRPQKKQEKE